MKGTKIERRSFAYVAFISALLLVSGAYASAEAQQGWSASREGATGKDLNAVYFFDARRGWVAGDGGLVFHTEDGGRTWAQQPLGITESINDLYFRDKENGYLLAGNRIFTTTDSGTSWRESLHYQPANLGGVAEFYSVRFANKKKGWIVGSISKRDVVIDSLIISTTDGGASWVRQQSPTREELIHVDFTNDKQGWIVGTQGVVLHTEDGGGGWRQQRTNTKATLYHVDFIDNEYGWAVGERGTILRTTDGGEVWAAIIAPTAKGTLLSVSFVNEEEGWIVGRGGVILRSGDGGRTWVQQESHTKQNLYALYMNKKNGWAVGGDGMVLRYER